jgi:hypothetical protein
MKNNKLILLSFNELNFDFIKHYLKNKKYKNFSKIIDKITYTKSETQYKLLEPWIQWVSIYTGKKAEQHKIFRLGDIVNFKEETIFDQIGKSYSVGAICPMNINNNIKNPAYFIPDPWTSTISDNNFWSKKIHRTISFFVKDNAKKSFSIINYFNLLIIVIKFINFKNIYLYFFLIVTSVKYKWRKALFLDLLLNDIHLKLICKKKVNFSNLFLNAFAHIQHHYFLFSPAITNVNFKIPEWYKKNNKKDPLEEALYVYDKILGDYLSIKDYKLVMATGLTQVPYDILKFYYRLKNHNLFFEKFNIKFFKVIELMSRDFILQFDNDIISKKAADVIKNISLNSIKIFKVDNRGNNLFITLTYPHEISSNDKIFINNIDKLNLIDFISFVAIKNGMHSGEGFYYDNFTKREIKEKIDIIKINKIILDFFYEKNFQS